VIEPLWRSRRRRRRPGRWLAAAAAALALFAAGMAVGAALNDNPKPNLIVTSTKTLIP
jgi:hypothetical protein